MKLENGALKADGTAYSAEEIKQQNEFIELVAKITSEQNANMISKDEADKLVNDAIEKTTSEMQATLSKVYKSAIAQGLKMQEMENNLFGAVTNVNKEIAKAFEENKDAIAKADSGTPVKLTIKAVAPITNASATNQGTIPTNLGAQLAQPMPVNIDTYNLFDLVTMFNTSMASYPYSEMKYKEGSAGFQVEGAVKSQADFLIETRYAPPYTCAVWTAITTQSLSDIPGLQSLASDFLVKMHNLKKSQALISGAGTGTEPAGVVTLASTITINAGITAKVVNPNIMDVINAMSTTMYLSHNYVGEAPYIANLVLMNPADFFVEFVSAKDANGLPLFPTASIMNRVVIGNMLIVPREEITAGNITVCDMSKYWMSNYEGISIDIGRINDDFIKNQLVIRVESRYHAFVKQLDTIAFRKGVIATIKTAILKP